MSAALDLPSEPPPKTCACGRTYTAAEWAELRLVGVQVVPDWCSLELRDCECGSTLAVEVTE